MKNKCIKCDVDSCKHCRDSYCMLREITIGCDCADPCCKDETICKDFVCNSKTKEK